MNSISNINSPNFKIDSLISNSEIKDTNKLINELRANYITDNFSGEANKGENENSEPIGDFFSEDEPKRAKPRKELSNEKIVINKDHIRKGPDFNSISEIFADKVDFDMSTIKEMVESLEEDSMYFRSQMNTDNAKLKILEANSFDERKQNSFEKIIKYMKKEIRKIDKLKKRENKEKIQQMIKDFLINLKRIELIHTSNEEETQNQPQSKEKENSKHEEEKVVQQSQSFKNSNIGAFNIQTDFEIEDCDCSSIKEPGLGEDFQRAIQESINKDEENFNKDLLEPTPNKLPPVSSFTSKNLSPTMRAVTEQDQLDFYKNSKSSNAFSNYGKLIKRRGKQLSHNASKEELKTPNADDRDPKELLQSAPYNDSNRVIYK